VFQRSVGSVKKQSGGWLTALGVLNRWALGTGAMRISKKKGAIVLDQIWKIDKFRLIKKIGRVDPQVQAKVISTLQSIFAY